MPIVDFCRQTISSSKNFFRNLNLFKPPAGSDQNEDEQQRRVNTIITRIYLVLLICLLIYLGLFIHSDVKEITEKRVNPSKEELDSFLSDAACPCSHSSLLHGEFISLESNLHQICSSDFVLDRWIKAIYSGSNVTYFNLNDFRTFGSAQFQALAGFCNQSKSYLRQNIDSLLKSTFISPELLRRSLFQEKIQSTITQLQQTVPGAFAAQLELVLQVCSSYLISPEWIKYSDSESSTVEYELDYRNYAISQFQTLAMLCELAQNTTNGALEAFLQRHIVNSQVISQELFLSEMDRLIKTWKSSTSSQFKRRMELIRIITMRNHLMSHPSIYFQANLTERSLKTEPRHYGECNCGQAYDSCIEPMGIYKYDGYVRETIYTISNFFMGCYLVEALFLSTLECFYNKSCMTDLDKFFHSPRNESWIFSALNASLSQANKSIESIVNELMVDDWSESVNFSSYYYKCAPILLAFLVAYPLVFSCLSGLAFD
ncbi:unnamed protein product [Adineta steineri]|uniref:Uncharacterized protein n=1 Tax=Adineta steineri TaxID=433720 RepID=A0A820ANQ5_9BILA|nr:unnamed protein product [Adineta steineri]CAF4188338.1 unnamed protein product [Adineta steineri]